MALNKHLSPPIRTQLKINQVEKIHPWNWRNWLDLERRLGRHLNPRIGGKTSHGRNCLSSVRKVIHGPRSNKKWILAKFSVISRVWWSPFLSNVARGRHLEAPRLEVSSLICSRVPLSWIGIANIFLPFQDLRTTLKSTSKVWKAERPRTH